MIKTHELAKILLAVPDGDLSISIDVSTCDDDADRRIFGSVIDVQADTNSDDTVLLCDGILNFDE